MTECQNVEYKESWRDEYLKWLCGYANAQGGVLYIGKDDNGKTVGLDNGRKLLEDLPNKIRDVLGIMAQVNLKSDADGDFIEIIVGRAEYPVDCKGEYHYRCGSTRQQLTGSALVNFLVRRTGFKWDAVPVDAVSVDDLDKESFDIFRREARQTNRMSEQQLQLSNADLLRHLHLMEGDRLKRAAVLLFHREPENWFTGVYTKIGKFTGAEIDYMDEVHGSLILQADRVVELIYLKYLKGAISYKKDVRVETYPFARGAIREAVFNALCHSDWSQGVPIQVKIEEHQMYVSNMCVFPEGWTAETLMRDHYSMPHNPDIANTFYRAGFIEAWGRGIQRICEACDEINAAHPEYIIRGQDVMVRFAALGVTEKVTVNGSNRVTVNGSEKNAENTVIDCISKIDVSKNGSEKVTVNGGEKVTVNDKKVTNKNSEKGTNANSKNAAADSICEFSSSKKGTNRRSSKGTNKVTVNGSQGVTVNQNRAGRDNACNTFENSVIDSVSDDERHGNKAKNYTVKGVTVNSSEGVTVNRTTEETDRVTVVLEKRTTKKEYQLLVAITENPNATYIQLAERLNVSRKTIAERLKSLRHKGLLIREGADKKGAWKIVLY